MTIWWIRKKLWPLRWLQYKYINRTWPVDTVFHLTGLSFDSSEIWSRRQTFWPNLMKIGPKILHQEITYMIWHRDLIFETSRTKKKLIMKYANILRGFYEKFNGRPPVGFSQRIFSNLIWRQIVYHMTQTTQILNKINIWSKFHKTLP